MGAGCRCYINIGVIGLVKLDKWLPLMRTPLFILLISFSP